MADGGLYAAVFVIGDGDAVPAAEGVEAFFGVGFEAEFVVDVYFEAGGFVELVYGVVFFGVVGGEPVYDA